MRALEAARAAFQLDPGPYAGPLILNAVHAGRPEEALQVWEESDQDQTPSFDHPSPWGRVCAAQHMTARYGEQLATARRARELFPENLMENPEWVEDGKFTDAGMAMLKERMPHVDFSAFESDRDVNKVAELITVKSIVDFVERKLTQPQAASA